VSLARLFSVHVNATASTFEFSEPRPLFDSRYVNTNFGHTGQWNTYAVAADGQRFLIPRADLDLTSALANIPITVVLNWQAALPARER
jgi:hypothetical protein